MLTVFSVFYHESLSWWVSYLYTYSVYNEICYEGKIIHWLFTGRWKLDSRPDLGIVQPVGWNWPSDVSAWHRRSETNHSTILMKLNRVKWHKHPKLAYKKKSLVSHEFVSLLPVTVDTDVRNVWAHHHWGGFDTTWLGIFTAFAMQLVKVWFWLNCYKEVLKKCQADSNCRVLSQYFFTEVGGKAFCLVCSKHVVVSEDNNLNQHKLLTC